MKPTSEDILIIGKDSERYAYGEFTRQQVYLASQPSALRGRRFRHAYYTDWARRAPQWGDTFAVLNGSAVRDGGHILTANCLRPEAKQNAFMRLIDRMCGVG